MGLDSEFADGQTPLEEEEKEDLILKTITTRGELDEFEQQNIEEAIQWLTGKVIKPDVLLSEQFIKDLHKKMYGNVWKWAGGFRKTERNIGVAPTQIAMQLKQLLYDIQYWINNNIYNPEEIAIRFKHRLVSIHCFPNGNGRHSRLMADIIVEKIFGKPAFTWGTKNIDLENDARTSYLKAIRIADTGNINPLLEFACG